MSNPEKQFNFADALGSGIGGAVGVGLSGAAINAVGGPAILFSATVGVGAGFIGGVAGEMIGYWWDAPAIKWDFKSAALFTMVASGFASAVLYFLAIDLYVGATTEPMNATVGIGFLAAFFSAALRHVLDNLRL